MKRGSMLSRTFYRRPAVRDLVPDLKLVLTVLYVGCESHVGVYRPAGLGEDAGLDTAALGGALDDLVRRGHVSRDQETGEVFLTDFFRDNTFKTQARRSQARDDFMQIESNALREKVLRAIEKNPECGLFESDFIMNQQLAIQGEGKGEGKGKAEAALRTGAAALQVMGKRRKTRSSGIVTWMEEDVLAAEIIECGNEVEIVAAAVAVLTKNGKEPLPGLVEREIGRLQKARDDAQLRAAAEAARQALLSAPLQVSADIANAAMVRGAQLIARHARGDKQSQSMA